MNEVLRLLGWGTVDLRPAWRTILLLELRTSRTKTPVDGPWSLRYEKDNTWSMQLVRSLLLYKNRVARHNLPCTTSTEHNESLFINRRSVVGTEVLSVISNYIRNWISIIHDDIPSTCVSTFSGCGRSRGGRGSCGSCGAVFRKPA